MLCDFVLSTILKAGDGQVHGWDDLGQGKKIISFLSFQNKLVSEGGTKLFVAITYTSPL